MYRVRAKVDRRIRDGRRSGALALAPNSKQVELRRTARYVTESWPRIPARLVGVVVVLTGPLVKPVKQSPEGPGCFHSCEVTWSLWVRHHEMRGLLILVRMLSVHGPN